MLKSKRTNGDPANGYTLHYALTWNGAPCGYIHKVRGSYDLTLRPSLGSVCGFARLVDAKHHAAALLASTALHDRITEVLAGGSARDPKEVACDWTDPDAGGVSFRTDEDQTKWSRCGNCGDPVMADTTLCSLCCST